MPIWVIIYKLIIYKQKASYDMASDRNHPTCLVKEEHLDELSDLRWILRNVNGNLHSPKHFPIYIYCH